MADFWQTRDVVTLHNLRLQAPYAHTCALQSDSAAGGIAVVIPVRLSDFGTPSLRRILTTLNSSGLCERIVLVLNGADRQDYQEALRDLAGYSDRACCLWLEGKPIQRFLGQVERSFGITARQGKGLASWLGLGYALHHTNAQAICFQDADVEAFQSELLARMCAPIVNPELEFSTAKAYYARAGTVLYGRVSRLMLLPALMALSRFYPGSGFLQFLSQYRYPLSGEIAMSRSFATQCPMSQGWSMELSMLWHIYQSRHEHRACQVELTDNYRHRHHPLQPSDGSPGALEKMASEIALSLVRYLGKEGFPLLFWQRRAFLEEYAQCTVRVRQAYRAEAIFNGLPPNDAEETEAVSRFQHCLEAALEEGARDAQVPRLLPSWNSVDAAIPHCAQFLNAEITLKELAAAA